MMSPDDPWIAAGIHGRAHVLDLAFNVPSQHLIAHLGHSGAQGRCVRRLYHRGVLAETYTLVPGSGDDIDHDTPISCTDGPFVFFLVWTARFHSGHWGFDWESVSRLSLPSGEVSAVLTTLGGLDGHRRGWVSRILAASSLAATLTAVVGLDAPRGDGTSDIEYWIANISLGAGTIKKVAKLPTPFL